MVALTLAAASALAQVPPAPPPPDRPGIPPKAFPPDSEKPVALPYLATPAKVAVMLVTAHPDDEGMLVGFVPWIAQVKRLPLAWVVLTSGDDSKGVKPFGDRSIRENELRRAAWVYGLPNEPIFGRFRDGVGSGTIEETWRLWGGERAPVEFLVQQIRRYRPEVLVTLAFDSVTGHPNHAAAALAATKAADAAGDAAAFPVAPGAPAPWSPKKIYVHNWPGRRLTMDWTMPVPGAPGLTPHAIVSEGIRQHASQGVSRRPMFVGRTTTSFGLYFSSVGADRPGGDLFDNLDLSAFPPLKQSPGPDLTLPPAPWIVPGKAP
jgi:LmbE family N-acetylglucosaminyl deacetylase